VDRVPPRYTQPPQDVEVMNRPPRASRAKDYFRALERRYKEFQNAAKENQIAVMRYYTPTGAMIRVANVSRYLDEETILMQGEDEDGNPCDVVVQPENAQVVLKLITDRDVESEQPVLKIENTGNPESEEPNPENKDRQVTFGVYSRPV
jgi:hypothetical protein